MHNMNALNTIYLNVVRLFNGLKKRSSRYVPDNEIPDTHTRMQSADGAFSAADADFYTKIE